MAGEDRGFGMSQNTNTLVDYSSELSKHATTYLAYTWLTSLPKYVVSETVRGVCCRGSDGFVVQRSQPSRVQELRS